MFENILGQGAAEQLALDIAQGKLAPSMVFIGAAATGKGSAALELARVVSCETPGAPWTCGCPSCSRHRLLAHPDLLALGFRPFSAEIAAAADAFIRFPQHEGAVRLLLIRSGRKLLLRFSPTLWEDDPKLGKAAARIGNLEEDLDEIASQSSIPADKIEKLCASIIDNARKLEAEGMGDYIPVAQIRRAAYWSHLAPQGWRKLLLIERADRMQEGARNAMLKLLEEPPPGVVIVLTALYGDALLPTILSRLRPYRFQSRPVEVEQEAMRRVFRREAAPGGGSLISGYLDSFLPISQERVRPLAAFFAASLFCQSAMLSRNSEALAALAAYVGPIAETAGLGRPAENAGACISALQKANGFSNPGSFRIFLAALLDLYSEGLRQHRCVDPRFAELWRALVGQAMQASSIYNLSHVLVLEKFCADFKQEIASL